MVALRLACAYRGAVALRRLPRRRWRLGLNLFWFRLTQNAQAKESRTVPVCPRDFSGDGRKARPGLFAPEKPVGHDRDGVPFALVLADEDGAGLETAVEFLGLFPARQAVEQPDRRTV